MISTSISVAARSRITRGFSLFFLLTSLPCLGAYGQISLTSAVDLALRNSERIKMAESDVDRARAAFAQTKDVYIPNLVGSSSGLGYGYGFPLGPPTLFSISSGSLVFSYSQKDYVRAAAAGLQAASLALRDVRQSVAEDTVNTYLDLARTEQQHGAVLEERGFAERLQQIVKDRLDAGQDTAMEYTRARRTGVQLRLQTMQLDDDIASFRDHLSRLLGLTGTEVHTLPDSIPPLVVDSGSQSTPSAVADTPGVQAAFISMHQKYEQAFGDARYLWRPQVSFGAQYSKESFYNNGYLAYYPYVTGENPLNGLGAGSLPAQSVAFAVNVSIPLFDQGRRDRARETMAEAVHSFHDARNIRDQELEGRLRLQHSTAELAARAELASLDRDMAQEQLEAVLVQTQSPGAGPLLTPKDEQNARIGERQRFVELLDAQYRLRQAEVNLLRQTNRLEDWLRGSLSPTVAPVP